MFRFSFFYSLKIISASLVFLYIFLATKLFSEYEYGIFVLLLTLTSLSGLIFSFGIPNYLYELFSKKINNHELGGCIKHILVIKFFVVAFIYFFFNIFSKEISILFFKDYNYNFIFQILSIVIIFIILNSIYESYYIANNKPIISIIGNGILYPLFIILLILVFYFYQLNFNIFLKLILGTFPFITFFYLCNSKINFNFFKSKLNYYQLYKISFKLINLLIISLSGSLFYYSDIILLAYLSEPATLSNYHLSIKVSSIIALVSITNMSINFGISINLYKNKKNQFQKNFEKNTLISLLFALFIYLIIILFSDFIINKIYYKNDNLNLNLLIFTVCLNNFVNVLFGYQGALLVITSYKVKIIKIFLFVIIFNIFFNLLIFPKFGVMGIAFITLFSTLIKCFLLSYYFKKNFNFHTLSYLNLKNFKFK